jgi:universal stress protein E
MPDLSTIVAGVDFSHRSHLALSWAATHFAPDADFVLVHAMDLPVPPSFLGQSSDQQRIADELHATIVEDLEKLAKEMGGDRFSHQVPRDSASTALCEVAAQVHADLIVVGPHGKRGGIDGLLGSTAERVLTSSGMPVLLAAGDFRRTPGKILVAIDETPMRHAVLEWASFLSGRLGAAVTGFHCLDRRLFGRMRIVSSSARVGEISAEAERRARDWVRTELEAAGLPAEDDNVAIAVGAPAAAISEFACDDFDLLIIGSRREGTTERLLLGSVAKKVIRATCVPVLMVPVEHG